MAVPEGNPHQRTPDLDLEGRALGEQPQRRSLGLRAECGGGESAGGLGILDEAAQRPVGLGLRKRLVETPAIEKGEAGETALADDEQGGAERRLVDAPTQNQIGAQALVLARRDRLEGHEQVVQARAAGQADLVGGRP